LVCIAHVYHISTSMTTYIYICIFSIHMHTNTAHSATASFSSSHNNLVIAEHQNLHTHIQQQLVSVCTEGASYTQKQKGSICKRVKDLSTLTNTYEKEQNSANVALQIAISKHFKDDVKVPCLCLCLCLCPLYISPLSRTHIRIHCASHVHTHTGLPAYQSYSHPTLISFSEATRTFATVQRSNWYEW